MRFQSIILRLRLAHSTFCSATIQAFHNQVRPLQTGGVASADDTDRCSAVEMAKPVWSGNHPVGQIKATRPLYSFCATGLGAAMWFFVSSASIWERSLLLTPAQLMYRAKKDGPALLGLKHPWDH